MATRTLVAKPDAVLEPMEGPVNEYSEGTTVTRFRTAHGKIFERVTYPDGSVGWYLVTE